MRDPKIDMYIEQAQEFAKPILSYIRELIHEACPGVKESIKWGMPAFDYKGPLIVMGSFKKHLAINFWKAQLMADSEKVFVHAGESMGTLGKISSMNQLPPREILLAYLYEAIDLNENGIKIDKPKNTEKPKEIPIPNDLLQALNASPMAMNNFQEMSVSRRNEYINWVIEAKREVTRIARIEKTVLQVLENKSRDWKYLKK
ncbi:MAG: YdeI/OmpD-associated family protein [Bacteroidia bacterium]